VSEPEGAPLEEALVQKVLSGRTDLVWDPEVLMRWPENQGELIQTCAYFGDVSAVRYLLGAGSRLSTLGPNFDLNGASFHGHWRLCEFLLEEGADPNHPLDDTGETPLHAAFSAAYRADHDRVAEVLLNFGARPNAATKPGVSTGAFMRDVRTRGETPLHRAAACASEAAISRLIQAGASVDAKDQYGDTPLGWASGHRRPDGVLRLLLYGDHRIHPERRSMEENLRGRPTETPARLARVRRPQRLP
jgi:ankyrin repeat protein